MFEVAISELYFNFSSINGMHGVQILGDINILTWHLIFANFNHIK